CEVERGGKEGIEEVDGNEIGKGKIDGNKEVDKEVEGLIEEMDGNGNVRDKEKEGVKDGINEIVEEGDKDIKNGVSKEEIEEGKGEVGEGLEEMKDLVKGKEDGKEDVDKEV
ncbi:DUF1542 domain-containing protein, partial [Staphylococcus aureus]|uniref:DUF1542 domain-containing protein n=1 Tax=Staphylococcus aureus TaxID=1280 RepID=UPI0016434C7C